MDCPNTTFTRIQIQLELGLDVLYPSDMYKYSDITDMGGGGGGSVTIIIRNSPICFRIEETKKNAYFFVKVLMC